MDSPEGNFYTPRFCVYPGVAGRKFWSAAQAGTITGALGLGRRPDKIAPSFRGQASRADGSAVDSSRGHAGEKHAIKASITCLDRPVTAVALQLHASDLALQSPSVWPFPDLKANRVAHDEMLSGMPHSSQCPTSWARGYICLTIAIVSPAGQSAYGIERAGAIAARGHLAPTGAGSRIRVDSTTIVTDPAASFLLDLGSNLFTVTVLTTSGQSRSYQLELGRGAEVLEQIAYVKASNTGADDQFGTSVSLSGDTMVVGALSEDSNATGVDGDQADNSAIASGAVYLIQ